MSAELHSSELAPLVAQALNKTDLKLLEWRVTPLSGGASRLAGISAGVFRISGTALDQEGAFSWSLILKGVHASDAWDARDPTSWNYWKREALALQSGLLDDLPRAVSAPRCYAVQEQADDRVWLWLEDVQEAVSTWTMAHYGLAARHFGQFNGAYLCGTPLPKAEPWLSWGRVRPYVAIIQSWLRQLERIAQPSALQCIFRGDTLARLRRLADCEQLLEAFERLPISFCHLDAFRRNLFLRRTPAGTDETVAIDWAYIGFGRLGEEAGVALAGPFSFADVPISQAHELDQAVFTGYLDGLREAGWNGEVRQLRLGYTVNALVLMMFNCVRMTIFQPSPEMVALAQELTKRSWDELIEYRARAVPFILELGGEAYALAATM